MKPRILFLDIETAPNLAWVWGKWEQNVISFHKEWYILSFSAKWFNGPQITKGLIDYPGYNRHRENDRALVKDLWKLFNEADIIIAHNGDQFDIKKCNARFSFHKLSPPSPYSTVDTKKVAKKYFGFVSNSLDDLANYLLIGRKMHTGGFELWQGCMSGDKKSWNKMKEYNANDTLLLEKIYIHFLPWISNHPNYGMYLEKPVCPKCGSLKLQSRGLLKTLTRVWRRVQCQNCGGWAKFPDSKRNVQMARSL